MLSKPNERRKGTMRKLMISVLVAACVVGTFGMSLGAFTDTAGTKYSEAATLLSGLGLLKGYDDGTFKPGNTITRAEFSAVAVRALGLEAAASVASVGTKFTDVPASHWASGYINICSDQGIIKGYADGTFKPEAPVTYAEVLAMIVRMLGYEPAVTGTWPTNYIVKAYDIGLAGGITFAAGGSATRGDVALFIQKSLTIANMVQVWTGAISSYTVDSDVTLLNTKLGYEAFSGLLENHYALFGSTLSDGEVIIDGVPCTVGDGVDLPGSWFGQYVKVWVDASDAIISAVNVTAASQIVTGTLNTYTATVDVVVDVSATSTKTYLLPTTEILARNNTYDGAPEVGDFVQVVVDGDYAASIVSWMYDDSAVLTKLDTTYNKVTGVNSDTSTFSEDFDSFDAVALEKDGKVVDIKGLAVGDLLYYVDDGLGNFWGVVSSTKVTGKVESIDSDASETTVTVGGKAYAVELPMTFSKDGNKSIEAFTVDLDLADFDGQTATLYLNVDGNVRHMSASLTAEETTTKAVIKTSFFAIDNPDPEELDRYFVYAYKLDGTTAKLELGSKTVLDEDGDPLTSAIYTVEEILAEDGDPVDLAFPVGTLFTYTLKDGKVGTLSLIADGTLGYLAMASSICDTDNNMVTINGTDMYRASAATLFVDYYNWEIRDWDEFKNISADTGDVDCTFYLTSTGALRYLLYYPEDADGVSYGTKAANAGIVTGRTITTDGVKVKVLLPSGEIVSYFVDTVTGLTTCTDANYTGGLGEVEELNKGDYVTFKVSGDTYTEITEELYDPQYYAAGTCEGTGFVYDFSAEDGTLLVCDDPELDPGLMMTWNYVLALDCVVFDVSGSIMKAADLDSVANGQIVRLFADVDGYVEYIVIVD